MKTRMFFSMAVALALLISASITGYAKNIPETFIYTDIISNTPDQAWQQYDHLQKALANDDAATAQKAAQALVTTLQTVSGSKVALKAANAISKTKDIATQRKSFATLSEALIKLFKENKPSAMLYIHYCPMAKDYWLSDSKAINNPYYGKEMSDCGKTMGMIM